MNKGDKTSPNVYILETLSFEDEEKSHYEGSIVSQILSISGVDHKYQYFRTSQELDYFIRDFNRSCYRYLHLSCHGNKSGICTTLNESIETRELAFKLSNVLDKKRLFISACSVTTNELAKNIFDVTDCYSIIGPHKDINMDSAAIFWASFYHLLFKREKTYIKHQELSSLIKSLKRTFNIPLAYYKKNLVRKKVMLKFY